MPRTMTALLAAALTVAGCAGQEDASGETAGEPAADEAARSSLGPVDGLDLPPTDLDRVQAGDVAPDFRLTSLAGPPVSLSAFRGEKNVVLVFYRGHW